MLTLLSLMQTDKKTTWPMVFRNIPVVESVKKLVWLEPRHPPPGKQPPLLLFLWFDFCPRLFYACCVSPFFYVFPFPSPYLYFSWEAYLHPCLRSFRFADASSLLILTSFLSSLSYDLISFLGSCLTCAFCYIPTSSIYHRSHKRRN